MSAKRKDEQGGPPIVKRLPGWTRWLWIAIAVLTVGMFCAGLPTYFRQLQTVCLAEPCYASPTPAEAAALASAGVSLADAAFVTVAVETATAVVFAAVAIVLFWRRPDERMAWFTALTLLTFGTFGVHDTGIITGVALAFHPLWRALAYAVMTFGGTAMAIFFLIFPDGRLVPGWLRWPAILWAVLQAATPFAPGTPLDPLTWPLLANLAFWGGFFGVFLYAQVFRYRHVSSDRQRQQTKWVVFGMVITLVSALSANVLTVAAPLLDPRWSALALLQDLSYYPFLALLPLSIVVAILRSNLYDIDVVINRTLVYGALTGALTLIYGALVLTFQGLFQAFTGPAPQIAIVASTLATAALMQPLRRAIQNFIDRRFYRRKYDTQQVLAGFASSVRDETDLERLSDQLVGVVHETMQPASVALWLKSGEKPAGR